VKKLQNLRIRKRSVERLGCIKGCLEFLGSDISFPWLYGGTGHAFIISLDPGVDVSSPDSWNHQPQYDLGANLGYKVDGFSVWKPDTEETFHQKQCEAWDYVRTNIDKDVPCFGFELKMYYGGYWVIYGYDDTGYYYSGWEDGGPLSWEKLGDQFIPLLEVRSVQLCNPASKVKTVKDGLSFALRHASNPPDLIDEQAYSGAAAWEYWSAALESGKAKRDHHTYNAQLWLECREMAIPFLKDVNAIIPNKNHALIDEAIVHYEVVCENLRALIDLHPPREKPDWDSDSTFTSGEAAAIVREAGAADNRGLSMLQEIIDAL
jgi:hypothetical protein